MSMCHGSFASISNVRYGRSVSLGSTDEADLFSDLTLTRMVVVGCSRCFKIGM